MSHALLIYNQLLKFDSLILNDRLTQLETSNTHMTAEQRREWIKILKTFYIPRV